MINVNDMLNKLSMVNFEGYDALFFEHVKSGDFATVESTTKLAKDWLDEPMFFVDFIEPDTDYKKKLIEQRAKAVRVLEGHEGSVSVYKFYYSAFRMYTLAIDDCSSAPLFGISGLSALKVPREDHDKYWGPSLMYSQPVNNKFQLVFKCGASFSSYKGLFVRPTYAGVMAGRPSKSLNDECIHSFIEDAKKALCSPSACLVPSLNIGTVERPKLENYICAITLEDYSPAKNEKLDKSQAMIVWVQDRDPVFSGFDIVEHVKMFPWVEVSCDSSW